MPRSTVTSFSVVIGTTSSGLSAAVDLNDFVPVAITLSTAWTAASVTFQAAAIGSTVFRNLYDDAGTEKVLTVSASRHIALDPNDFASIGQLKLRSGTAASPVAQGASRTLGLVGRRLSG